MNRSLNRYLFYNPVLLIRNEWFYPYLKYLSTSQWQPLSFIEEKSELRLMALCDTAKKYSSYYKKTLPDKVSLESLRSLPFLDKNILRNNSNGLRALRSRFDRIKTTGGSTGAAVTLYKNSRAMAEELAATWRGYNWAGVQIGDRQARFWGVPSSPKDRKRAQLIDFVCNRLRVSAFSRTEEDWKRVLTKIQEFKGDYFYGYVSVIKEFAEYLKCSSHELAPKAIITTSEVLTATDRGMIETVLSSKVFNEYGCGEVGTIAHECDFGNLHINAENMIIEVIDDYGNPVPDGQPGEIVVTDLSNTAMPIIRYRMADWGVISKEKCQCGRSLPALGHIYGRAYDSLINSKGEKFHGEFFLYIIEDANKENLKVDGVQFVQLDMNKLEINIVCRNEVFNSLQKFIEKRIYRDFDRCINIIFNKVENIAREKSGKLRVVKRIS